MSGVLVLPDVTADESALIGRLWAELQVRIATNRVRRAFYDGERLARAVSTVIPPIYQRLPLVLGWSAKAVDTLARRCNLDGVLWPDGDLQSLGLSDFMTGNRLQSEINGAVTASLLYGPAFLVTTRGDESLGEPAGLLHVKDALSATGDWNPRTRRLDNLLSVTGTDGSGNLLSFALYLKDKTIIAERDTASTSWQTERQSHKFGVPVDVMPYRRRPDRPFGQSRISRVVMSLHQQALRTVIRMEAHADVFSFPDMWLLGADMGIFKNDDGSLRNVFDVMMGRLKGIPDDEDATQPRAEVKQFPAASPQPHLDMLEQQAQLFSGETSIPLTSLGVSNMSNPTSADSYIASREDLIAEAEGATDDWSADLSPAIARGLAIQNGETSVPDSWKTIQPKWRSPVYLSRAAQADAGFKQLTAVPELAGSEVGLELIGLDRTQIEQVMGDRRREAGRQALLELQGSPTTANGDTPDVLKAKFDALAAAIRAGVTPESAASSLGLSGLEFTGAVPITLRQPDEVAAAAARTRAEAASVNANP